MRMVTFLARCARRFPGMLFVGCQRRRDRGGFMSAHFQEEPSAVWARPGLPVEELLEARGIQPIRSLEDLRADTFSSDQELEEFLAFTSAERHRDLA